MQSDIKDTIAEHVERVAEAICNSVEADNFDDLPEGVVKEAYRQQARAAIAAMPDVSTLQSKLDATEEGKANEARIADKMTAVVQAKQDEIDALLARIKALEKKATMFDVQEKRIAVMEGALNFYANTYCEGWCRDCEGDYGEECGGCRARAVLQGEDKP